MTAAAQEGTLLSVVVPMYDEEDALPAFAARMRPVLDGLGARYEVLAVDDGSTDKTAALLRDLSADWPELRMVRLRRNSGHQAALTAGLDHAVGDYVASIDADLQDPPEKIPDMLELARREGLDIVYGVREDRSTDTGFKRWTAGGYYWLIRRLVGRQVPSNAGDFRLLSREAVEALRELPDQQRVYRLLVPWLGFPSGEVRYVREERVAGSTKYPLTKMVRLALDSITGFSAAPLRLATWLGTVAFFTCLLLLAFCLTVYLVGATVPGWTSLFVGLLFIGGVQLICVGLLGEYVARIYSAVQRRPAYFVAEDTAGAAGRTAARSAARSAIRSGARSGARSEAVDGTGRAGI
ncbi:glycosyltransferase family 2 protein [Kitasatospora sp. NPDC090308]|uniref:glycosyltransferase family 2 protein n=1 Tax=Kitasatospora sp. NPDC090308 TaxID=3364082 RepID=UPI00380AF450